MRAEDTVESFPTYADLTLTKGWAEGASHAVELDDTVQIALDGPRYTEGALLGAGGMGKVVLARDARIGREVAVKQLHAERELTPEERARFLREARVQGQLEHPSIVPVYDIDRRPDGTTFFTMRRVIGRTLHAILEDLRGGTGRHTQRELLSAFATVCLTIDYAHSRGVVHRDIKPANIMLGDFGEVYVLDWGLARLLEDSQPARIDEAGHRLSMTGEMMGTPLYMAPEQMSDPQVGPAADVFALGAILFEILTLERLRDAKTLYLPAEARPSVRAAHLGVAPELEAICVKATESDPRERYASARELQEKVARFLEGDRDLERRRQLAAVHDHAAREALARAESSDADFEQERGIAMRELARAIALDPANEELVATLGNLLATPPRITPAAVREQEAADEMRIIRTGARHSIVASLLWFAFLPFVMVMGFVPGHAWQTCLVLVPAGLSAVLATMGAVRRRVPLWIQLGVVTLTLIGAAATSRLYGPLVLVPTLVATFCIVIQAHPSALVRHYTWAAGALAVAVPILLEAFHVVSPSYAFEAGRIVILPQIHELPRTGTFALLLGASLTMMIVPCVFISKLRSTLNLVQRQLLLQAWHFRRLGEELTAARTRM